MYEAYELGKQDKRSSPKEKRLSKSVLELVYSVLCNSLSISGLKYYLMLSKVVAYELISWTIKQFGKNTIAYTHQRRMT